VGGEKTRRYFSLEKLRNKIFNKENITIRVENKMEAKQ
jgi:hypothetical protein